MTIYEIFFKIILEYKLARNHEQFAGHKLADYIRNDLPGFFNQISSTRYPNIKWHASAGIGRWVTSPWIAAFHKNITNSAQQGYYPVYLFSSDLKNIYLSFNFGVTDLRNDLGDNQAISLLQKMALGFRERLQKDWMGYFSPRPIDLKSEYPNSNLEYYEYGHAFGKVYDKYALPNNETFRDDLKKMLEIYSKAVEQYHLQIKI